MHKTSQAVRSNGSGRPLWRSLPARGATQFYLDNSNEGEESTYTLLVRSEEPKRGIFETIIYSLMILSAIAAILQFAHQRDSLPLAGLPESAAVHPISSNEPIRT